MQSESYPEFFMCFRGTAALIVICVLTDFFGTLLTGLGLRSTDPNKKYKYYRVAIYALLVASKDHILSIRLSHSWSTWKWREKKEKKYLTEITNFAAIALFLALIIYPVSFSKEIDQGKTIENTLHRH